MPREKDKDLLDEIKRNWEYAQAYWAPIYEQGDIDIRYAVKGPWDDADYAARGVVNGVGGRPTLVLDELGQYRNQLKNQVRQNKRAVKVKPEGDGANDQTALQRAGIIRGIEYKSKAQQAYSTAFDSCVDASIGFAKLTTDYEPGTFNRCIKISPVPNFRTVYIDPDFKQPDCSDTGWDFEIDRISEKKFLERWPKAEVRSFTPEMMAEAPLWITHGDKGKYVQVAAYCRVEWKTKKLALLQDGSTLDMSTIEGAEITKAKSIDGEDVQMVRLPDGSSARVLDVREDNDPVVWQYVTNGLEILERNRLDFKETPHIPCFGPETWVSEGGAARREFGSLIRPARGPYKAYCYAASGIVERLGQDPKTPYEGWEGQFDTNTDYEKLATNGVGYVEFSFAEGPTGQVLTDKPTKNFSEPQIQQYATAMEAFRRAIQAAMGGSPLPTSAQRNNEKSGVALAKIEESSDEGNFHFQDKYNFFLERIGRMIDGALDVVYSPNGFAGREVPFNDEAGEHKVIRINKFVQDDAGAMVKDPESFHLGESGAHGVTISTGPSSQSQRDAADDFADSLLGHPELLGPTPNKVVAQIVRLKNIGAIGDRIADLIAPPEPQGQDPQIAAAQQMIQQLGAEIEALKRGDAIKKYTVDEQEKTKRVALLLQVDQADAQHLLEQETGVIQKHFDRAHEHLMASSERDHQSAEADRDRQASADAQLQDQSHQASQAEQERAAAAKAARSKVQ